MFSQTQQMAAGRPPPTDVAVTSPPTDTVQCLAFSPVAEYLAAASWDSQVRVWEIQPTGQTVPKTAISHQAPALTCSWSPDGTKLFHAGCDKQVRMTDLATGQTVTLGQHDAPVSTSKFAATDSYQMLVTGSWDQTLKYWDVRSPNSAITVRLSERCYGLDLVNPLLATITADNKISFFNMAQPQTPHRVVSETPLKHQLRCVAVFPTADCVAVGSIEGRVAIEHLVESRSKENFSFRCHRDPTQNSQAFPINAISVHSQHKFATCGGDGTLNIWDKEVRQRVMRTERLNPGVSTCSFNRNVSLLAYAIGYSWTKGVTHHNPSLQPQIMLHPVTHDDITAKQSKR